MYGVSHVAAHRLPSQPDVRPTWPNVSGNDPTERKLPIDSLLSPKKVIDVTPPDELTRWKNIKEGMAQEPDLFPPINVAPGAHGTPLKDVEVVDQ